MKNSFKILTFLSFVCLIVFAGGAWYSFEPLAEPGRCTETDASSSICLRMRSLRSHVMLLGAQRDLMQVNFPLLISVGQSVQQLVHQLMTIGSYENHLDGIVEVQKKADELVALARQGDPDALASANSVRAVCSKCHKDPAAAQHLNWNELSKIGWETIVNRCNEVGRNPHICKNMYGMVSAISYFQSAAKLGMADFDLGSHAVSEVIRIGSYVRALKIHGNGDTMSKVLASAEEVRELIAKSDSTFVTKGSELAGQCFTCHK